MASNLFDIYSNVNTADETRKDNDFYPTAPIATYALCKYGNVPKNILEPCAGRGNISIELERNGHIVTSHDLYSYDNCHVKVTPGIDVFGEKISGIQGMVTNPPYFKGLPVKILQHSINNYDYSAILVRLTFLESKSRFKLFKNQKPTQLIFFSDRLRFGLFDHEPVELDDQLGGMIAYCWVIFDKTQTGTKVDWVMLEDEYEEWRQKYDSWAATKKAIVDLT